jgi:hypothetical protein
MRLLILTVTFLTGMDLFAISTVKGIPANHVAIEEAAFSDRFVQPVWWHGQRWHRRHNPIVG